MTFIVNGMTPTPVTPIFSTGFEHGDAATNGLTTSTHSTGLASYRKSIREANGAGEDPGRAWGGAMKSIPFRVGVREAILGFAVRRDSQPTVELVVGFQNTAGAVLTRMRSQGDIISLRRSGSAELAVPGFRDLGGNYTYFFLHSFHDQSQGFVRLYADNFEASRLMGEGTGDTSDSANVHAGHFYTAPQTPVGTYNYAFDDVVVYARTLFVSSFTGATAGETITGGTSGATAVIDAVETDDADATKAVLYLAEVTGDFEQGETLTISGGGSGDTENAHPEDIHGLIRPVFVRYRVPTSTIESNWTRSAGAATDHEAIDDRLTDNGEYLETAETGTVNEHGLEGAPAGLYAGATFVQPLAVAEQDSGGVGSLHLALRSGSTISNGDALPVPGSAGLVQAAATTLNPDTGEPWAVDEADAVTLRIESAA